MSGAKSVVTAVGICRQWAIPTGLVSNGMLRQFFGYSYEVHGPSITEHHEIIWHWLLQMCNKKSSCDEDELALTMLSGASDCLKVSEPFTL